MAPRKNHTCKHGKRSDGYCRKRPVSGFGRSAAMKQHWEGRRIAGLSCKYGRNSDGYCSKKPTKKAMKAATRIQALVRGRLARRA